MSDVYLAFHRKDHETVKDAMERGALHIAQTGLEWGMSAALDAVCAVETACYMLGYSRREYSMVLVDDYIKPTRFYDLDENDMPEFSGADDIEWSDV